MSLRNLPHLAQRLFNVPLAITPDKLEVVMAAMADRMGLSQLFRANGDVLAFDDGWFDDSDAAPAHVSAYDVVRGVAIIPVTGTLVAKLGTMRPSCGMTGYDGIRASLSLAMDDPEVKAIAFDMESPGGEVAGCFDLVDTIYHARGTKPMWSILSETAYSACYALASATDRIVVPRTGGTGSVGVISACIDMSEAMGKAGIKVELITFGARKADGNEFSPLTKEARARFQADVDMMGNLFVDTVARNRAMDRAKVLETQATTFLGSAGVDIGFADAVMAPDQAFQELIEQL